MGTVSETHSISTSWATTYYGKISWDCNCLHSVCDRYHKNHRCLTNFFCQSKLPQHNWHGNRKRAFFSNGWQVAINQLPQIKIGAFETMQMNKNVHVFYWRGCEIKIESKKAKRIQIILFLIAYKQFASFFVVVVVFLPIEIKSTINFLTATIKSSLLFHTICRMNGA